MENKGGFNGYQKDKKIKAWSIFAIITMVCLIGVAIAFGVCYGTLKSNATASAEQYHTNMENVYRKSYYELCYNVDGLAVACNKLSVSATKQMQNELLADITTYSTAASVGLSNLAGREVNVEKTMKFINQTGDYAKYLNGKLNGGGYISAEDRRTLAEISDTVQVLRSSLNEMSGKVERDGFAFADAISDVDSDFSSMLASWQTESIDYPSMIYDGPFSDSLSDKVPKALKGEDISESECETAVRKLLAGYSVEAVDVTDGSRHIFDTYDCTVQTSEGRVYVTVAKQGGFPVSIMTVREVRNLNKDASQAEAVAEDYLAGIEIAGMKAVWVSKYNNVYYVNCAYTQNGVIVYPDLIKVAVDGETGQVVGLESLNYIYNHTVRNIPAAAVAEEDVPDVLSVDVALVALRLAIVPTKGGGEMLAWEAYGTKMQDKYFIYVSAESGNEVKIMQVIDSEAGQLLQ